MRPIGQDNPVAPSIRIAALIVCPPLLAFAYSRYCASLWYDVLLACAPIAGGWIGLASRPILDASAQRRHPRFEFSGKGFILGSIVSFLIAFAFAPSGVDRTALMSLFLASSSFYYALGKIGCLFLGCCRATAGRIVAIPLPVIEAAWSCVLSVVALLMLYGSAPQRLWSFPVIVVVFLSLRITSRYARGSGLSEAFRQLDSLALAAVACCATIVAIVLR